MAPANSSSRLLWLLSRADKVIKRARLLLLINFELIRLKGAVVSGIALHFSLARCSRLVLERCGTLSLARSLLLCCHFASLLARNPHGNLLY